MNSVRWINHYHKYADIGFLVGEKSYWGRGIAAEAISLATTYAFET
jgi:RimJ/RimL family protein N-acetyltransferase